MTTRAGLSFAAVLLVAGAACSHPQGPSLNAAVEDPELVPTSSRPDAREICCCRVRATITNVSAIGVDATVRWLAEDTVGDLAGAIAFVEGLGAGERRVFEAGGILHPCARVVSLTPEVRLSGLYTLR